MSSSFSSIPSLETQCLRSHGRYNQLANGSFKHASVSVLRAKATQLASSDPSASTDLQQLADRLDSKPGDGEVWQAINKRWSTPGSGIEIEQLRTILTKEFSKGAIVINAEDETIPDGGQEEQHDRPDIDELLAEQEAKKTQGVTFQAGATQAQLDDLAKAIPR